MAGEFDLKGLDGVLARMRTLAPKLQKRGLGVALRAGANIVKRSAVANAKMIDDPATSNMISKNITVQNAPRAARRHGGAVLRVGIIGGAKQYVNDKKNRRLRRVGETYYAGVAKDAPGGQTWYWRFVEFGTSRTRARPFLRPALESNTTRVVEVFGAAMEREIDKAIAAGGR